MSRKKTGDPINYGNVSIYERPVGSGKWDLKISYKGVRRSKRIGHKREAIKIAQRINYAICLDEFNLPPVFKKRSRIDIDYLIFCNLRDEMEAVEYLRHVARVNVERRMHNDTEQ